MKKTYEQPEIELQKFEQESVMDDNALSEIPIP